jgi:hypothetical protein
MFEKKLVSRAPRCVNFQLIIIQYNIISLDSSAVVGRDSPEYGILRQKQFEEDQLYTPRH